MRDYSKQESILSDQRFDQRKWQSTSKTDLMQKTFPIEKWDQHFSSLGSKRAPIQLEAKKEKKLFKSKVVNFSNKTYDMSEWDQRMVDLQQQAGISTDERARKIYDRQLYGMFLQDTTSYQDLAGELSLRDINKFQHRRNHSKAGIPVTTAGSD